MITDGQLTIKTDITAGEQESSFMNATLQSVGGRAVSIAVYLPDHMQDLDEDELIAALKEDFKVFSAVGYEIEIQIGPDE